MIPFVEESRTNFGTGDDLFLRRGRLHFRLEVTFFLQFRPRMIVLPANEELTCWIVEAVLLARRGIGHIEDEPDVAAVGIRVEAEAR